MTTDRSPASVAVDPTTTATLARAHADLRARGIPDAEAWEAVLWAAIEQGLLPRHPWAPARVVASRVARDHCLRAPR